MDNNQPRVDPVIKFGMQSSPADWIAIFRTLCSASSVVVDQVQLHGQLVRVEWAQEKHRLTTMLVTLLFGLSCFITLLIFTGILVLVLSWDTEYRIAAVITLCSMYAVMLYVAWLRLLHLSDAAANSFIGSRTEIAADIALIKSKLL